MARTGSELRPTMMGDHISKVRADNAAFHQSIAADNQSDHHHLVMIHKKLNRNGHVVRITLAFALATGAAAVVQVFPLLSWWTIGAFFVAIPIAFSLVGKFHLKRN